MACPKAIMLDLDDTLAPSFESPTPQMIERLMQILDRIPVAIITGRDFPWMARDFLPTIVRSPHAKRFYVLPEGSAQCFQWSGTEWHEMYGQSLPDDERQTINKAILESVAETGLLKALPIFGEQFVQKKAMVAFATLGMQVPNDLKYSWDPGNARRAALCEAIARKLPDYDVVMGGATSIDVTKKGVNKAYGVKWLAEKLGVATSDMLYVGDALYPGGNDAVVIPTGIQTRETSGPDETLTIIDEILKSCET